MRRKSQGKSKKESTWRRGLLGNGSRKRDLSLRTRRILALRKELNLQNPDVQSAPVGKTTFNQCISNPFIMPLILAVCKPNALKTNITNSKIEYIRL